MHLTLHIGIEKTGTTSIQRALAADRVELEARGILFPKLFGSTNHMELAVGASDPNPHDELQMIELQRQQCGLEEYRHRLRARLREEIGAGGFTRVVVSNEHCHSRVRGPEMVRRLIGLFPIPVQDCEVIVYLRRQDRLAVSLYSTVLKLGGTANLFPEIPLGQLPRYFDFERLLNEYAQVVGSEKIFVRLYEPQLMADGDVVRDFYHVATLGITPSVMPRANKSLSLGQAIFLDRFNERFPMIRDGKLNEERGPIFQAIKKVANDGPFKPDRSSAETFYRLFQEGNARVKARFLPDLSRASLFDEDFSGYPETLIDWKLSEADFFDFVEAIWRFKRGVID